MKHWLQKFGLLVALVVVCLVLAALAPRQFPTWLNLVNVARQISINGILAVGVTFVILTAGVDLSLGSLVALTGVVAALAGGMPLPVAIGTGVVAGMACGAASGAAITLGRVAPFVATLGMMTIARGLALLLSGGKPVAGLSPAFKAMGDNVAGIPIPVLLLAGVATVAWIFLTRTRPGRHIYAVGGNERAALAAGIGVRGVKMLAYCVCGALAGLAGVVQAARNTVGQPNAGIGYELDAIAAVVIGGTSLSGGVGGIGGTLLGALLMGVINNGLDLLGVDSNVQQIVKGVLIVGAVLLDRKSARRN